MTGDAIDRYRLLVLRSRIKMEVFGLKGRGTPTTQIVREEFGITERTRAGVLRAFETILIERGVDIKRTTLK